MEEEEEEQTRQRKSGAKPNSIPFTVPENRLLAELYLANKTHYHAKSRVVVGEKNGETSQERFGSQFATELSKLGFAHRTSAQVKQRIADVRKLAHKLIIKEKEKSVDNKKKKKVFVEPWLRKVMDALLEELQETGDSPIVRKRTSPEKDPMSMLAQSVLDSHLLSREETPARKIIKMEVEIDGASTTDPNETSTVSSSSSTVSDPDQQSAFLSLPNCSLSQIQQKLIEAQLRVALKTEKLLDLKIRKIEIEMAAKRRKTVLIEEPDEELSNAAELEAKDLIRSLLTLKGEQI